MNKFHPITKIVRENAGDGSFTMEIETAYPDTITKVEFTGYKGGDAGHGGKFEIDCTTKGSADIFNQRGRGFYVRAEGDMEIAVLVDTLEAILEEVKKGLPVLCPKF